MLKTIKKFADDISQQSVLQKFLNANTVKKAFDKNINEFEAACKDLHFTLAIYSGEQKEQENVQVLENINILERAMNETKEDMKNVLSPLNDEYKVPSIEDQELTDLDSEPDNVRGSNKTVVKKIFRGLEVAWKCPKIISFFGLSEVDQNSVMVFEWASNGNLKDLYTIYEITWTTKLKFIRDIFNGLFFMHRSGILHHDIRCENILITRDFDAKISNFKMSRLTQGETTSYTNITDYVRWLAPEKIREPSSRYNHKCEMFSLGMLVWELSYQRIPYEKMNLKEIQDHVSENKRETLEILLHPTPIPKEFAKFIKQAWEDNVLLRPTDIQVSYLIKTLCEKHLILGNSPRLTLKQNSNNDISYFNLNQSSHLKSSSYYSTSSPIPAVQIQNPNAEIPNAEIPNPKSQIIISIFCRNPKSQIPNTTWEDNVLLRPTDIQVSYLIKTLCEKHLILGNSPRLTLKQNSNNDISYFNLNQSSHLKSSSYYSTSSPIPAVQIQNPNAEIPNAEIPNPKSQIIISIFCRNPKSQIPNTTLEWFKMAADEGVPDAQLRYAFRLLETNNGDSKNNATILHYMTLAADGGNETAMYNLRNIYYHGKLGVDKDEEKGIELIKLAALKKQPRAIDFLKSNKIKFL
ncbi:hypothetical protein Glove_217g221 [Diversispora epigaea]|uniref:Protein kinase domain-containing protein n=1 Tax=Diversispora epigaea TaxID=1348612 RepID=A0A397ILL8_9GLOM|nr:hypothetical protein Glove_217g221 [Diversispora epigaea]